MSTRTWLTTLGCICVLCVLALTLTTTRAADNDAKNKNNANNTNDAQPAADKQTAQDPAKLAPDLYKVTLDNDRVRVLDIHMKPGQTSPMHSHPAYLIYCVTPGKIRFTMPDGKTADVDFKAGETMWRDAETHEPQNIGDTEVHVLNIELKGLKKASESAAEVAKYKEGAPGEHAEHAEHAEHQAFNASELKFQAGPPGLPKGGEFAVLSGDPTQSGSYAIRAKFPAGYTVPPHFHSQDENVTVISGKLAMGLSDQINGSNEKTLTPGGYMRLPAGVHHYAVAKEDTVIQVHGQGPFDINYLNPKDDPRKQE